MRIMQTLLRFLPLGIIALIILQFVISNEIAGLGEKVALLDDQTQTLADENTLLSQKVASASSLVAIASRAHELGFVESAKYMTVGPEQFPVAVLGNAR